MSEKSNEDKTQIPIEQEERTSSEKLVIENEPEENNLQTASIPDLATNTSNDLQPIESEQVRDEIKKPPLKDIAEADENVLFNNAITLLQFKNNSLLQLRDKLTKAIEGERNEIKMLKKQLNSQSEPVVYLYNASCAGATSNLDEIMDLLSKENQILQIKKINLVRQIMEQQEMCIDMKAKINLLGL